MINWCFFLGKYCYNPRLKCNPFSFEHFSAVLFHFPMVAAFYQLYDTWLNLYWVIFELYWNLLESEENADMSTMILTPSNTLKYSKEI